MNSKTLTLAGAVVLIIGLFLPAMNMGEVGLSVLLPAGQLNPPGLILVACAVLAGILALINQAKWAIVPGIAGLGYIVWQFLEGQKELAAYEGASLNYLGWGVMGLGAVLIVIGGAMGWKSSAPAA